MNLKEGNITFKSPGERNEIQDLEPNMAKFVTRMDPKQRWELELVPSFGQLLNLSIFSWFLSYDQFHPKLQVFFVFCFLYAAFDMVNSLKSKEV